MCVIKGWYKADYTEALRRIDSVIETRWELRVLILGNHFQLANSLCVSMPNALDLEWFTKLDCNRMTWIKANNSQNQTILFA